MHEVYQKITFLRSLDVPLASEKFLTLDDGCNHFMEYETMLIFLKAGALKGGTFQKIKELPRRKDAST